METLQTHVAGVDVHKDVLAITVLIGEADSEPKVTQFESKTFTGDLIACGQKLLGLGVTHVAMESTGVYWKAPFNVWAPMGIEVTVGQASHLRNVPGRKTDMNDSHWIAKLHRHGLIKASFIPDEKFQQMRLVSRQRTNLVEDLARVKNRIQRVLEDGNVKMGSITSDVFGKSGRQVLELIASGETNSWELLKGITTKIKKKEEAREALVNCLSKVHCQEVNKLMRQLTCLEELIAETEEDLGKLAEPYSHLIEELKKIPGINDVLASAILAEATNQMDHFKDARTFAAWSGVAAGNNESAGKKKRAKVRRGNPHLRKLLVQAAQNATKTKGSFYRSKYNKLKFRLGSANKAKVAIANRLARVIYYVLGGQRTFKDKGYKRGDPWEQRVKGLINQLRVLGCTVDFHDKELIGSRELKVDTTGIIITP